MPEERTYYDAMIKEYDLPVCMRDGVNLRVDVYRPDAAGQFPVLYTCAMHNKDLQRVEVAENLKVGQPAWSTQWYGVIEGGDSKRFVDSVAAEWVFIAVDSPNSGTILSDPSFAQRYELLMDLGIPGSSQYALYRKRSLDLLPSGED